MSALPNSNASTNGKLALTVDGHMVLISDLDAAGVARKLDADIDRLDNQRLLSKLRLGVMLRQVRDQKVRGTWEPWLKVTGIDPRRARAAIQLAEGLAGRDSAVDLDKWVERGLLTREESELYRHNGAGFPAGVSLRQAEVAVGIRKAAPVAPVGAPVADEEFEVEDTTQYDTPEQLEESVRVMREHREKREREAAMAQGGVVVTVDAQGLGTVQPAAERVGEPPVARDQAVAGRIGPAELGRARRPEVAGQMTLAPLFDDVYLDVQRMDQAGRGEKARAIVAEGLADIRRRLAELGEAA